VIAGWTAGILIMLILPLLEPCVAWADLRLRLLWVRVRGLRSAAPLPSPIAARGPGLVAQRGASDDDSEYARPTVGAVTGARPAANGATAVAVDPRLHHSARAHAPRHDRSPAAPPPGTRRPRPDQRNSRTAPLGPR
jgi:hypothetical protein